MPQQNFNRLGALQEGWRIHLRAGAYRIERVPYARTFLSDDDAWIHVLNRALFGVSGMHIEALEFIRKVQPDHFEEIAGVTRQIGFEDLGESLDKILVTIKTLPRAA